MVVLFLSCGAKAVDKESVAEKSVNHYTAGMEKLKAKDFAGAETEFKKAVDLNKNSPDGYIGMSLLRMRQEKYKDALKQVRRALSKDENAVEAYIAKGRILTARKDDDWLDDSMEAFTTALEHSPDSTEVYYYRGEAYLDAWRYDEAREDYERAVTHAGALKPQASARVKLIDDIVDSAPKTEYGHRIIRKESIDRQDLCILLVQEFGLIQHLKDMRPDLFESYYNDDYEPQHGSVKRPSDVTSNQYAPFIEAVLPLKIMYLDTFPNGNFFPNRQVTRSVFSYIAQEIMVTLLHDPTLATRYIGSETSLTDVREDYYAYNAIRLCLDEGIMDTISGSTFKPEATLSGTDVFRMLRRLENAIR